MTRDRVATDDILGGAHRLALGTVQFGLTYGIANREGQVSQPVAAAMIKLAATAGIDTIDTAIGYGNSEDCLGSIGVSGFKVVTKLPALPVVPTDVRSWVRTQLASSLERLGTRKAYGLLLHRPMELLGEFGRPLFDALCELRQEGLVQKIGVSIYSPAELLVLMDHFVFDLVQAPFNLVDRRLYKSGCLQRLKQSGVEVHVRSTFLQGLLLMPRQQVPEKFSRWGSLWDRWQQWQQQNEVTALEACLACTLAYPEIDRVVIGADSLEHMQQIVAAANRSTAIDDLPLLASEDEQLINPANWPKL